MKKISPDEIKKDLETAKKVSYTPAGAKGVDKLMLSFCRGLREKVDTARQKVNLNRDAKIMLGGLIAVGGIEMINGFPQDKVVGSLLVVSSLPAILDTAVLKVEKPLRNLEAAIIKRIRKNDANSQITVPTKAQHAR